MPEAKDPWRVRAGPDEPVGKVASRVVGARLRAIPPLLRAAERSGGEPVHALRVATRRARAALDVFGEILGTRRSARFEKGLRRMRRVAGEARDLDVLLARLRGRAGESRGAPERALGELEAQRREARAPLVKLAEKCPGKRWRHDANRLVATIGGRRAGVPFDRFATRRLAEVGARFAAAIRAANEAPRRELAAAIHGLRIVAKKTRYATEILAVHAPPGWRRRRLERLERFQDLAGEYTDRVRAGERLRRLERRARGRGTRASLGALARDEEAAAADALAAVLRMLPALARMPAVPGAAAEGPRAGLETP